MNQNAAPAAFIYVPKRHHLQSMPPTSCYAQNNKTRLARQNRAKKTERGILYMSRSKTKRSKHSLETMIMLKCREQKAEQPAGKTSSLSTRGEHGEDVLRSTQCSSSYSNADTSSRSVRPHRGSSRSWTVAAISSPSFLCKAFLVQDGKPIGAQIALHSLHLLTVDVRLDTGIFCYSYRVELVIRGIPDLRRRSRRCERGIELRPYRESVLRQLGRGLSLIRACLRCRWLITLGSGSVRHGRNLGQLWHWGFHGKPL